MKIVCLFTAFLLGAAFPAAAGWKVASGFSMDWPNVQMEQTKLADHLYYLHGSGANMCVSTGPDGIVLVDCEFTQMSDKIKAAIATIQPGPVRFLIDTHFHTDHSGGNADFAKDGTVVIGQDHVRERLAHPPASFFGDPPPPSPPLAMPVITYDRAMTLHCNGEDIQLFNEGVAHTDTDTVVWFPKSNVVHLGDIYINGLYPIIDVHARGTIEGYFPIIDRVLGMINDDTKVIPGHGPVATKKQLQFYRDMLAKIRDRVKTGIAQGKTLAEITATNPSREFDADWASDRVGPEAVTKMVYESLAGLPGHPAGH